jgi:hypothetical protein
MGNDGQHASVWSEYKWRRTLTWAIPLMLFVVAFTLGISYVVTWLFVAPIVAFAVLQMLWFQCWPCPRCGKPFTQPKRDITYSKQCRHCGLALWKDPGDVDAYREKQRRGEARLAAYKAKVADKRKASWRKLLSPKPRRTSKRVR